MNVESQFRASDTSGQVVSSVTLIPCDWWPTPALELNHGRGIDHQISIKVNRGGFIPCPPAATKQFPGRDESFANSFLSDLRHQNRFLYSDVF